MSQQIPCDLSDDYLMLMSNAILSLFTVIFESLLLILFSNGSSISRPSLFKKCLVDFASRFCNKTFTN